MTPEQISTFIAHIVSKPIPAGEQDFCLTHFAPYYTPAQLHHAVDNFISVLKVSGLTWYNKRPIALEKILPNLCTEQKYKVLDFFIEEMDKAFLPDGHHREGTWEDSKLALMLCQVLDDVNQEYREKIRKRIVRLVDADHAFIYCKKVFLKCLTIGGGFF